MAGRLNEQYPEECQCSSASADPQVLVCQLQALLDHVAATPGAIGYVSKGTDIGKANLDGQVRLEHEKTGNEKTRDQSKDMDESCHLWRGLCGPSGASAVDILGDSAAHASGFRVAVSRRSEQPGRQRELRENGETL